MNDQERQQAFLDGLSALSERYGFQMGAQIQTRQLGVVVQCEPILVVLALQDWVDPAQAQGPDRSLNGKGLLSDLLSDEEMRKARHPQ